MLENAQLARKDRESEGHDDGNVHPQEGGVREIEMRTVACRGQVFSQPDPSGQRVSVAEETEP